MPVVIARLVAHGPSRGHTVVGIGVTLCLIVRRAALV